MSTVIERQPDVWGYRYHDCIRFDGWREFNGSRPTESIPCFFASSVEEILREDLVR